MRFNDEQVEETAKGEVMREGSSKRDSNEMEIKFISEQLAQDNMSALSRSIGKQWDDEDSMIVWETNNEAPGPEDKNSGLEDRLAEGQAWDTDQETVKQLEANLRDRESKDTGSVEWVT